MASTALAQANDAGAEAQAQGGIADIIVTAQFRNQKLQDTPIAITAIDADGLAARGQTSVTDIAQSVPNLSLRPYTYGAAITAMIRGVGQFDPNPAVEPGVGMYVDDVFYGTLVGSQIELLDLERVEVLRGPQGTLAGRNSIGGAVKIYAKKPGPDNDGFLSAAYGSYDRTELRGGTNFTLAPDHLWARISGVYKSSRGYVTSYDYACTHPGSTVPSSAVSDDCVLGHQGGVNIGGVRGAIRWQPAEGIEVNLSADYTRDRSEPVANTLLAAFTRRGGAPTTIGGVPYVTAPASAGPITAWGSPFLSYTPYPVTPGDSFTNSPYANYSTFCNPVGRPANPATGGTAYAPYCLTPRNDIDIYGFSGSVDADLGGGFSLKSVTAYRAYKANYAFDQDLSPAKTSLTSSLFDTWQFSHEMRISGRLFDALDLTVGGMYFKQRVILGGRLDTSAFDTLTNDHIPSSSKAAFVHADWELLSGLHLIGGLRYTSEEKNYIFDRRAANGDPISTVPAVAGFANYAPPPYKGTHVDYRAGIQYNWTSEFMTYGQFATGFKGGGVNSRPFSVAQVKPFGIETLRAFEAGFKSTLFNRRLRLNGALFTNRYSNIQITALSCPSLDPTTVPCAAIINAGTATLKGGELEATFEPFDGLTIEAAGSLLDFQYKSLTPEALASGITINSIAPFVVKQKFSVGIQYRANLASSGTLTPRIDIAGQTGFYSNAANDIYDHVAGNTVINARLAWQNADRDLEVALSVANLTDKLYYNTVFDNRASSQAMVGAPAAPRTWLLSIKRTF